MIKVLIVDDEPLARENLRVFLQEQSDIEIVGECSNAEGRFKFLRKKVERYCTSWLACSLSRRITALMVLSALNKKWGFTWA